MFTGSCCSPDSGCGWEGGREGGVQSETQTTGLGTKGIQRPSLKLCVHWVLKWFKKNLHDLPTRVSQTSATHLRSASHCEGQRQMEALKSKYKTTPKDYHPNIAIFYGV